MAVISFPARNRLAYPAGTRAGVDPSHPAAQRLAISAVSTGANFVDLLRGVKANSVNVLGASVDGALGLVTKYSPSASYVTFSSVPFGTRSSAMTLAGIFRSTSASDTQTVVGIATAGLYDALLFYTSDSSVLGWYDGAQHNTSLNVVTNQPYFAAASANAAGINFILKNLATGQVQTAVFTGTVSFPTNSTDVTVGDDYSGGTSDGMGGFMAAAMMNLNFMSMPQLLAWADDPWAFWYPPQARSLVAAAAITPTTVLYNLMNVG